ncbi:MAG: phosphoribosylanthranilate isomerase [Acidobacteriia bacterium]|nr:phosphoribosylanthranilate isomerase [Terriglobia bacterium]
MIVKICGLTNAEDTRSAVDAGASALGFNFWPGSPRYIAPAAAEALLELVPAGVWKVGVFVNEPPDKVRQLAARLGLDVVQIHGDQAAPEGLRTWKAISVKQGFHVEQLRETAVEAFLLDAPAGPQHGGTGRTFDWSLLQAKPPAASCKIVLAGGLDASNVGDAIQAVRPWGVDACSRLESGPGKKDHRKVMEFVRAALHYQISSEGLR